MHAARDHNENLVVMFLSERLSFCAKSVSFFITCELWWYANARNYSHIYRVSIWAVRPLYCSNIICKELGINKAMSEAVRDAWNLELHMTRPMHPSPRALAAVSPSIRLAAHPIPSCVAVASHMWRHTWHAAVGPACMPHVKRGGGPRAIDRGCIISYPWWGAYLFFSFFLKKMLVHILRASGVCQLNDDGDSSSSLIVITLALLACLLLVQSLYICLYAHSRSVYS